MSLKDTLLLASTVLFFATILVGILPIYLFECFTKQINRNKEVDPFSLRKKIKLISWLNRDFIVQFITQVGGGILLHTSLVHMVPEIREDYQQYVQKQSIRMTDDDEKISTFPDLLVCFGFFGMFAIEELIHCLLASTKKELTTFDHNDETLPDDPITQMIQMNPDPRSSLHSQQTAQMSQQSRPSFLSQQSFTACDIIQATLEDNLAKSMENKKPKLFRYYLLDCAKILLAFSCHSIFDGIAIAVQPSQAEIWQLSLAILSHKLIIAFILSFQVYDQCLTITTNPNGIVVRELIAGSKLILWIFGTIFASMSPLGICLAMLINNKQMNEDGTNSLTMIVLSALTTGTILYIVFLEIINKSIVRVHIPGIVQLIALLLGFCLMYLVAKLFHEH